MKYGESLVAHTVMQSTILGMEALRTVQLQQQAMLEASEGKRIQLDNVFESEGEQSEEISDEEDKVETESKQENEVGKSSDSADAKEEKSNELAEKMQADEQLEKPNEDDMAIAWEVLDTARVILKDCKDKESQLKLSEVYNLLGEVSMETENFSQAASDYKECCVIKESLLEKDNRALAESHYKLAMALEYSDRKSEALIHVQKCLNILKNRRDFLLSTDLKGKGKLDSEDPIQKEMQELMEIFPDMEEKIQELKAFEQPKALPQKEVRKNVPVTDVTSLIKKRKTE